MDDEPPPRSQIPISRPTGIATEIVLVVGLGSFLVGVTLTVVVWCLHLRLGKFDHSKIKHLKKSTKYELDTHNTDSSVCYVFQIT